MSVSRVRKVNYVVINRLIIPVSSFILLVIIGRMSDQLLGEYALVTTFYFILQTLPLLGLSQYIMREVSRDNNLSGRFYTTISYITALVCLLFNILFGLALDYFDLYDESLSGAIGVVLFSIFPGITVFLSEIILISLDRAKITAYIALIENVIRVVLSVIVLQLYGTIESVIWALFVTKLVTMLVYLFYLIFIEKVKIPLFIDVSVFKKILHVVPVFFIHTILFVVVSRTDYVVLSVYEDVEDIGYYSIGYRLYEIVLLLLSAVFTSIFPYLSRQFKSYRTGMVSIIKIIVQGYLVLMVPVILVTYVLSEYYVYILFNNQYEQSFLIAKLFVLLILISGLDMLLSSGLIAMDLQRKDLNCAFAGGVVYVALLVLLIPLFSIYGAIIAAYISIFLQMILRVISYNQYIGYLFNSAFLAKLVSIMLVYTAILFYTHSDDASAFNDIAVILLILLTYPLLIVVTGIVRISRLLRYIRWLNRKQVNVSSKPLLSLLKSIACDARRYDIMHKKRALPGFSNKGFLAVLMYRLSRYFYLKKYRLTSRLFWQLNLFITGADIPAHTDIGEGLVLINPNSNIISGKVGKNVTFSAFSGIGADGKKDIGAGIGMSIIGDNVVFRERAVVLGTFIIPSGLYIPAHTVIQNQRDFSEMIRVNAHHEII